VVGLGAGVVVAGGAVVAGGPVVVGAVVGGWMAGSDFSPQPATATAASAAATSTSANSRRLPASACMITAGTVTKAFSGCLLG
jgi:hypothetical protein